MACGSLTSDVQGFERLEHEVLVDGVEGDLPHDEPHDLGRRRLPEHGAKRDHAGRRAEHGVDHERQVQLDLVRKAVKQILGEGKRVREGGEGEGEKVEGLMEASDRQRGDTESGNRRQQVAARGGDRMRGGEGRGGREEEGGGGG